MEDITLLYTNVKTGCWIQSTKIKGQSSLICQQIHIQKGHAKQKALGVWKDPMIASFAVHFKTSRTSRTYRERIGTSSHMRYYYFSFARFSRSITYNTVVDQFGRIP